MNLTPFCSTRSETLLTEPENVSQKPYLIRALYDWIVDSALTPYLLVDATGDAVHVPPDFVEDGKIVLNISATAVRSLALENDAIGFDGRFSGSSFAVYVPIGNVLAIYAKESGQGMMFETSDQPAPDEPPIGPALKVVK